MSLIVITIASLLIFVVDTQAVVCHKCVSQIDPSCGSVLTYSPPTCNGEACLTFTGAASGMDAVVRDCIPSQLQVADGTCEPINSEYMGLSIVGTYCYCVSDYCNGDGGHPATAAATVAPVTTYVTNTIATTRSVPPVVPTVIALTALAAASSVPPRQAPLTCYSCDSVIDGDCSEMASMSACRGDMCRTFTGVVNGTDVVRKNCVNLGLPVPTGCVTTNTVEQGRAVKGVYCYCDTNFCNRGHIKTSVVPQNSASAARDRWPLCLVIALVIWFTA